MFHHEELCERIWYIVWTLSSFCFFFDSFTLTSRDELLFSDSVSTPLAACCYPCFMFTQYRYCSSSMHHCTKYCWFSMQLASRHSSVSKRSPLSCPRNAFCTLPSISSLYTIMYLIEKVTMMELHPSATVCYTFCYGYLSFHLYASLLSALKYYHL